MVSSFPGSTSGSRISMGGFASGLDTNAIIDALIAAQQRPVISAQSRLATLQTRQASLNSINSSVANLTSRAAALKDLSVVGAKKATTNQPTTEASKLTASASSAAAVGSFTVDVLSLATATKLQSVGAMGQAVTQNVVLANGGFSTAVTAGTFTVNGATVTIDASTVLSDGVNGLGANTIIAKIQDAGVGVTATIVNDSDGRANLLQVTAGSAITLGSGGDTSNFLTAANLLQAPAGSTRTSTRPMAGVNQTATLENARLLTALSAATGSFTVNGVSITWDRTVDSLANVISRINGSTAGVTASYDLTTDRLLLTRNQTGSSNVALADVSGNFLAATRVLSATQTLGANASYKIDGGATQYSASNTVSDAVAGVTLTLQGTTASAITVTVAADNATLRSRMQNFVDQFNSSVSVVRDAAKYSEKGPKGPLFGDPMVQNIEQNLRSWITRIGTGMTGTLTSLSALGLGFGAVGSAVGTTSTLTFDTAKFDAAVASSPEGVRKLLAAFSASATLDAGGAGSILSISGKPTTVPDSGKYTIASDASGNLTVTYTPDSGSTPVISTGTITAGGTNTSAIPGVTITAKPVLVAGTDTITISATEEGVGKALHEHLESLTRTGGPISGRTTELQKRVDDLNKQITTLNSRIDRKREQLVQQFTQLELTMQRLNQQQAALTQMQNVLSQVTAPRRR